MGMLWDIWGHVSWGIGRGGCDHCRTLGSNPANPRSAPTSPEHDSHPLSPSRPHPAPTPKP